MKGSNSNDEDFAFGCSACLASLEEVGSCSLEVVATFASVIQ